MAEGGASGGAVGGPWGGLEGQEGGRLPSAPSEMEVESSSVAEVGAEGRVFANKTWAIEHWAYRSR